MSYAYAALSSFLIDAASSRRAAYWQILLVHLTAISIVVCGPIRACLTFRPPGSLQWMIDWPWVGIHQESVPIGASHDLVPNVRVDDLEPCACRVSFMLGQLQVPQILETLASFRGAASVRAHEEIKAIERVLISFTLALNEFVEFGVGFNFAELERHRGGYCCGGCRLSERKGFEASCTMRGIRGATSSSELAGIEILHSCVSPANSA